MSKLHTTPICTNCNYDLTGIATDNDTPKVCPECGARLDSTFTPIALTRARLHRMMLLKLLLPTAIPPLFSMVLFAILNIVETNGSGESSISYVLFIAIMGLTLVGILSIIPLWVIVSVHVTDCARPFPRPVPRWSISLIALLYLIPSMLIYLMMLTLAQ